MEYVYSLEEAEIWFLENRDQNGIICVKNSTEKVCKTYVEAVLFFDNEIELYKICN